MAELLLRRSHCHPQVWTTYLHAQQLDGRPQVYLTDPASLAGHLGAGVDPINPNEHRSKEGCQPRSRWHCSAGSPFRPLKRAGLAATSLQGLCHRLLSKNFYPV